MTRLRIGLDARLVSGTRGGVEQAIIGLAHGLSQLTDGDEEYLFLTHRDADAWLRPHIGGACRAVAGPPAPRAPTRGIRAVHTWLRLAFHYLSPLLGRRSIRVPRSDGILEAAGASVLHFTTQDAFQTSQPNLYQPWDLQHLHLPHFFTPRERLAREVLYRTFCAQATIVVTPSRWGKADLLAHYGLPADKIVVVPGAPAITSYPTPSPAELEAVRRRFSLPDAFVFYPAQTWPHKNHMALLEALAELRDRAQLTIPLVCSGAQNEFFPKIKHRIHELQLEQQVHFLGFVDAAALLSLYRLCRALIFPTLFEGLGLPLLEAMQVGVPVAASNVTCLPEVAGGAALLFDPRDLSALGEVIRRVWGDEALRRELAERGYRNAERFSWERTARVYRAHYRRMGLRSLTAEDESLLATSGVATKEPA